MKKIYTMAALAAAALAAAQDYSGRVGINTTTPSVSLDIKERPISVLPAGSPQGISFTNFTTAERTTFANVKEGTMIYNSTLHCLEIYRGLVNGIAQWSCIPDSNSQPNVTVTPAGFTGSYIAGIPLTSANSTRFKLCNNGFNQVSNVNFEDAVTVSNGLSGVTVNTGQNTSVSLQSGACQVLSYTLSGTPQAGSLSATFNKLNLFADQATQVGVGEAAISNARKFIFSMAYSSGGFTKNVQGKINNAESAISIDIPYKNGNHGSYAATSATVATTSGQNGDVNNLTLNIQGGNFNTTGNLQGVISVDGDGEYLVKMLAPGQRSVIATFPMTINNSTFSIQLIATGGVPDMQLGIQTNGVLEHEFVYMPVDGPDGQEWLYSNLGAEYTNIRSTVFKPDYKVTDLNDNNAAGSHFQFQRKADGHELNLKYGSTPNKANSWTNAGTNQFIYRSDDVNGGWTIASLSTAGPFNLWQANGVNNPCPSGYHVPTDPEVSILIDSGYDFAKNQLNLVYTRTINSSYPVGWLNSGRGFFWKSSVASGSYTGAPFVVYSPIHNSQDVQANGIPVRCRKD